MSPRLIAAVRSALLLLPAVAIAGAAPATKRFYVFHCRLVRIDGTEVASPTISAFERQPCSFTAGGTAPTLRHGVTLDYGNSVAAWAAPTEDGKLLVDVTVSTTNLDAGGTDGVTVTGSIAHTVRTLRPGQPAEIAIVGTGLTLHLTVDDRTP